MMVARELGRPRDTGDQLATQLTTVIVVNVAIIQLIRDRRSTGAAQGRLDRPRSEQN